jgi:carboxypeptidase family protein
MKRALMFFGIFALANAAAMVGAWSVQAEPQRKGTSTLTGVVLGPDDKPVPRAAVSYQSSSGSGPHAVHTDARGRFTITKLQADNYDVRASGRGVFSEWQKNVTLHSGQTREITLRLIYARKIPKSYTGKKSKP